MNLDFALLAQIPTAIEFGGWALCAAAALVAVKNAFEFSDRFRSKPPAEQLEICAEMSRKRMDQFETNVRRDKDEGVEGRRQLYQKVEEVRKELKEDITSGLKGVHGRVDDVLKAVAELRGELNRIK